MSALDVLPADITDIEVAENPDDSVCEFIEYGNPCSRQALYRVTVARKQCACSPGVWAWVACICHKDETLRFSAEWICDICDAPIVIIRVDRI